MLATGRSYNILGTLQEEQNKIEQDEELESSQVRCTAGYSRGSRSTESMGSSEPLPKGVRICEGLLVLATLVLIALALMSLMDYMITGGAYESALTCVLLVLLVILIAFGIWLKSAGVAISIVIVALILTAFKVHRMVMALVRVSEDLLDVVASVFSYGAAIICCIVIIVVSGRLYFYYKFLN
ncbi:hypothetical protein Q1695_002407 [Nippostrongylus brasiliensis]|nr:hypothetical protein Q1695_002407 [Nippostrongylus brasiliensis]